MSFWRKKIIPDNGTLLIDVRNTYIRTSVIVSKPNLVNIVYSKKHFVKNGDSLISKDKFASYLNGIMESIAQEILPHLDYVKKIKVSKIIVVFSSPWYKSQMRHVQFKKDKPSVFTKKTYEQIISNDSVLSQDGYLEKNVTHILLNDYELRDPFNKLATSVDIAFYASKLDTKVEQVTREIIEKHITKKHVSMHSSGFVNFQVIRSTFPHLSSFMFLDVSNNVTEMGIIKDGVFDSLLTIPLGKKNLLESISTGCKMNNLTMNSTLNMLAKDELDSTCSSEIYEIVQKEGLKWSAQISQAITTLEKDIILPHKLFLFSDTEIESFMSMLLKSSSIQKNIFKTNFMDIILLNNKHVVDKIKIDNESSVKLDSLLLTKSLFLEHVEK